LVILGGAAELVLLRSLEIAALASSLLIPDLHFLPFVAEEETLQRVSYDLKAYVLIDQEEHVHDPVRLQDEQQLLMLNVPLSDVAEVSTELVCYRKNALPSIAASNWSQNSTKQTTSVCLCTQKCCSGPCSSCPKLVSRLALSLAPEGQAYQG